MSLFGKLFGGKGSRAPISAREALPLAQEAAAQWAPAKTPHLCCVYTAPEDSQLSLDREGRCRAWHVDYYLPEEQRFLLVRVQDGKVKKWEKARDEKPVEYVYAVYGAKGQAQPDPLPGEGIDSGVAVRAIYEACAAEIGSGPDREDYHVFALCLPATHLRHAQAAKPLFAAPPASAVCYGAIVAHIDVEDHDAFAVYVDVRTGHVVQKERFRFPSLVIVGCSADW